MNTRDIRDQVAKGFPEKYVHFREFCEKQEYRPYWEKCLECLGDRDFVVCVKFCNDVFGIPPVKTFLSYYLNDFIRLTGNADARLDLFVKRSIGAFWGMVFKFVLNYKAQESVSVSMNQHFMVKTATRYSDQSPTTID